MTLPELAARVDPLTAGLFALFWLRFELWRRAHARHHEVLAVATRTEVPDHV